MYDNSHYFVTLLYEMMEIEQQVEINPLWQTSKNEYYKGYCSFMSKVYQLVPGTGFHIWSTKEKEYAEDHVTLLLNPDIDALLTFCMSLHKMKIYTQWAATDTHWIVFVYKK